MSSALSGGPYNGVLTRKCQERFTKSTKAGPDKQLFADRLRLQLLKLRWRAPQLAEALRERGVTISRQSVNEWTLGALPSGHAAAVLADVLGVTADWLWRGVPVDERERNRALLAAQIARAVEHVVLTGNTPRLEMLAVWLVNLANDLHRVDPSYDTLEIRRAADQVRELIG